jgi:hypothetical protein
MRKTVVRYLLYFYLVSKLIKSKYEIRGKRNSINKVESLISKLGLCYKDIHCYVFGNKIKYKFQFIKNGFSDIDLYDLDKNICLSTAKKLDRFSQIVNSYPDKLYKDLNTYKMSIRENANNLKNITGSRKTKEITESLFNLIKSGGNEKDIKILEKELLKSESNDLALAKQSLNWVSDNLEHLWE